MEQATRLIELGWGVFPARLETADGTVVPLAEATPDMALKKVPIGELVEHGFKEATSNPRRAGLWWRVRPDALIGVAMPRNTVALDVDEVEKFAAAGLDLPDGPGQQTLRGGYHRFFKTDGRRVRQTVKEVPGADTRVGGRGYVIAWQPEAFPAVADLPPAPEWLYDRDAPTESDEEAPRRRRTHVEALVVKMGERDNRLTSIAGVLRRQGGGPNQIYVYLKSMVDDGLVEQTREDPITDKDLRRIAGSIGGRQSDAIDLESRAAPELHHADELYEKDLRELEYPVADIFPEGLGIVAGAPKVGKSWLTFQAAIQIAAGSSLLGKSTDKSRPVLYYGLEDGERRFQKRMKFLLSELHPGITDEERRYILSYLGLRYESPAIGEGLERDVAAFIDDNGGDAVVFIDVLAKIRPRSSGKGSVYDEDYGVLGPLQTVSKERPGSSIVVVTHDRKMGAEDPLTTVTGSRGVVGAADWVWVIKRPRLEDVGTIFVTGRDIERDTSLTASFRGVWTRLARVCPPSLSIAARQVWEAVDAQAPVDLNGVTDAIYGDVSADLHRSNHYNAVLKIVAGLEAKGYAKRINDHKPYLYHVLTDDDLTSGHIGGLVPEVTRSTAAERASRAGAPAGARERGLHTVHVGHVEGSVESPEHSQHAPLALPPGGPAPAPVPAPARTRARGSATPPDGVSGGVALIRTRPHAPAHTRSQVAEIPETED